MQEAHQLALLVCGDVWWTGKGVDGILIGIGQGEQKALRQGKETIQEVGIKVWNGVYENSIQKWQVLQANKSLDYLSI